jgi:outer membrane protein
MVTEQVHYQENLVKTRRGQFFPVLSAGLTHSRSQLSGTSVGFTFRPRNYSTSASLALSWNLFTGFSDKAQYEQSKVSLNNARHDSKKQALEIEREVRQAYYSLMQTFQKSGITEKNRTLASRQLALEQERYRLGSASQLDLRTAQTTFEQAQSDYIGNVFSFWINLAALERAVGQKLQ